MSNIRFFYNNLFDLAYQVTPSSENDNFPASNLQNRFRTKVWRTAGAVPGTANLIIDHGTEKAVASIILANYSWASAPGTLNLEFNSLNSWGAPAHSESLSWAATPDAYGNQNVIVKCFASQVYRYNRLNVVYSPNEIPADWDLGRIFLGTYFEPENNFEYGGVENPIDPSYIARSVDGQEHIDEITGYREREFVFPFESAAQWLQFQQVFNRIGISRDLFIAFDYDTYPNDLTMYGKITRFNQVSNYYHAIAMGFRESR